MHSLGQDLRYGVRVLLKSPGFTLIAVVTLTLGIGANTAIFSVVNAVLLRPLPYPDAHELVFISERDRQLKRLAIAWPNYLDWRAQNRVFESIGIYNRDSFNLTGAGDPQRLLAGQVSADLFKSLKVNPVLGRLFINDEDQPGAARVVVLSYALWQSSFAGDHNILNRSITLNDEPYTVIGVMPKDFDFPARSEIWIPAGQLSGGWQHRNNHPNLYAVARLKQGLTIEQARADLDRIAASLEKDHPETNGGHGVAIASLFENAVGDISRSLWILFAAALLVLAVACTNVANLMLVRGTARHREFAIRVALGASRGRIARQVLVESLLLSVAGSAAAVILAYWLISTFVVTSSFILPRATEVNLDARVLFFTFISCLFTGLLFGLIPAWKASRLLSHQSLREAGRGGGVVKQRTRSALVMSQIALALVLLISAGLLLRSFYEISKVNTGFAHENVLSFTLSLPSAKYKNLEQRSNFYQRLLERLNASPAVDAAGLTSGLPFGWASWRTGFVVEGQPLPPANAEPQLEAYAVSPDYFRTMGIPLRAGRFFTEQDNRQHLAGRDLSGFDSGAQQVLGLNSIVIDEEFARRYWPNESAVGKRIRLAPVDQGSPYLTVVGVAGRVHMDRLTIESNRVQGYFSYLQFPMPNTAVVVKSSLEIDQLTALLRSEVQAVDPYQPIFNVRTLDRIRSQSILPERLNMSLLSLFAVLALLLATVGIYGVISFAVAQRTHEIGVRMALGAQPRDVIRLLTRQGLSIALLGVGIGLTAALLLTRFMSQMLFRVGTTDWVTFIAAPSVLFVAALAACYVPARRATKVDPLVALRYE